MASFARLLQALFLAGIFAPSAIQHPWAALGRADPRDVAHWGGMGIFWDVVQVNSTSTIPHSHPRQPSPLDVPRSDPG